MTIAEPPVDVGRSLAQQYVDADVWAELVEALSDDESQALLSDWSFWRRPSQTLPDGAWDAWLVIAGRGFGKTRTGAESVRELVESGQARRVGIVAPTAGDGRDVLMEGESGLLRCYPEDGRPKYEPSKRRVTWPKRPDGTQPMATLFSGDEPDRLRGPAHDLIWIDEPASMARGEEVLDNARFGLRVGDHPRLIMTGTPRPKPWLRDLSEEVGTVVTTGSTYDNMANLPQAFIDLILGRYEGTRLGLQEIHARWLDDVEGALWSAVAIERGRIIDWNRHEPRKSLNAWLAHNLLPLTTNQRQWRTIVAVDPPGETAECGIVVGMAPRQARAGFDHAAILDDMSMAGRPEQWGAQVVSAWRKHDAEAVYVEKNQGGDMVRSTIHAVDPTVPVHKINAAVSKKARAEPIAALYERRMVHHTATFTTLEDQLATWVPNESKSPDRLDALVHCVRELLADTIVAPARSRTAVHRRIT